MTQSVCQYCRSPIEKPKRMFCSHACAVSHRKGTVQRRGPNKGISYSPTYNRDRQRKLRGWTPEQMEAGIAVATDRYAPARKLGYRSMFEATIAQNAEDEGYELKYEPFKLKYTIDGNYVPDFVLDNGIIIEAKGFFDARSRAKMVAVKRAHPDLDIRFVFMKVNTKVRKGSDATYADWCKRYGFLYAEGVVPLKWTKEQRKEVTVEQVN